ncbi:MAG: Sir2 silent information regulator family NAD-dependent deacetylase [Clostridiales bacterium]|nr:Sir2 silent information regulator family NAD-dependent deacetylase [Clostridiales bacterium]
MFSKKEAMASTPAYAQAIEKLSKELAQADAIVVGAGAGLSTAAGIAYSGERFEKNFADFIAKYHYSDMYSAGFYPYPSAEEYWAYWSRHIYVNRYVQEAGEVYHDLLALLKDKNYFVLTTNVDHCFQKSGFDKHRLFYTQGDYGLWQCSKPCHVQTYDNETEILQMISQQKELQIPSHLVPRCPKCGKPMTNNLRCDDSFVQDEGWHIAADRYADFMRRHGMQHLLFLELGVGGNTPSIIKYPFWQMTYQNPDALYACVNLNEAFAPKEIQNRSICLDMDIGIAIGDLKKTWWEFVVDTLWYSFGI